LSLPLRRLTIDVERHACVARVLPNPRKNVYVRVEGERDALKRRLTIVQSKAKSVDAYVLELPADRAAALAALRDHIKRAAPTARESMLYGMPTYTMNDEMLFAMASQKQNLALYVADVRLVEQYSSKLGATSIGKSCIRFRALGQLSIPHILALMADAYRNAQATLK
jgi:uncharacterized protein YdhG (YjbR/CyaY superfamily)